MFKRIKQTCSDDKKEFRCSLAEGEGRILPFLRWFFYRIVYMKLSLHYWLILRRSEKRRTLFQTRWEALQPYRCVDWYIISWLALSIAFFLLLFFIHGLNQQWVRWIFVGFLFYRLLDIFQAWVYQFVLLEKWQPISPYRSLVLLFIGYVEIIISYAIIAFIFQTTFFIQSGTATVCDSLYYSVRTATFGSIWEPMNAGSYAIFYTQLIFAVLFITAAIQRILGRISSKAD